jgi:Domain of unknown function (DUF4277)
MESLEVSRLDHLGIVSGVIDDLGLVDAINARLQKDKNGLEVISPGGSSKRHDFKWPRFCRQAIIIDTIIFSP